jgi:hypothetical protein
MMLYIIHITVNTIPKDIPSVALLPGLGENIRLLYVFWFHQNPQVLFIDFVKVKLGGNHTDFS